MKRKSSSSHAVITSHVNDFFSFFSSMSALRQEMTSSNLEVFWTTLLDPNHLLTVVMTNMTAGVITKNKLAIPEESCPGTKQSNIPVSRSCAGCNLNFARGQHRIFTYAEPKLWYMESRILPPNSQQHFRNRTFLFQSDLNRLFHF